MFTPPASDWTVNFLNHIFGVGWQTMYLGSQASGGASVLESVMGSLNAVAFIVMAVFYSYASIVAAYSTAHEGVALGSHYHWAYTPIRGMIGFGLLAPVGPKGLCVLQGIVLMFVFSGIGLADHLWNDTLAYLQSHGGAVTTVSSAVPTELTRNMLESLVVRDYLVTHDGLAAGQVKFTPEPAEQGRTHFTASLGRTGYTPAPAAQGGTQYAASYPMSMPGGSSAGIASNAVGDVSIWCPTAPKTGGQVSSQSQGYTGYCDAEITAVDALLGSLQPLAVQIVQAESSQGSPTPPNGAIISNAIAHYQAAMGAAQARYANSFNEPLAKDYKAFVVSAKSDGWASAGSWYLQIARVNNAVHESLGSAPTADGPQIKKLGGSVYSDITPLIDTADTFYSRATGGGGYIPEEDTDKGAGRFLDEITKHFKGWSTNLTVYIGHGIADSHDPMASLQSLGDLLIDAANSTIGFVLVGGLIGHFVTGSTFLNIISWYARLLYIPGYMLAFIVPVIPFVMWTLAIVAWVILVIESWIAAPIWAIAHGMPEGEGFVGQHARQGYMLFFSVLFKPPLLVVGFFASLLLLSVILPFIAKGFDVFVQAQGAGNGLGVSVLGVFGYTTVFAALCIIIIKKCFDLITWVPDNILRWIGNNTPPLLRGNEGGGTGAAVKTAGGSVIGGGVLGTRKTSARGILAEGIGNRRKFEEKKEAEASSRSQRGRTENPGAVGGTAARGGTGTASNGGTGGSITAARADAGTTETSQAGTRAPDTAGANPEGAAPPRIEDPAAHPGATENPHITPPLDDSDVPPPDEDPTDNLPPNDEPPPDFDK